MFTALYLLLLQPRDATPVDYDNLPARQVFDSPAARPRAWDEAARGRDFTVQARSRAWLAEDLA